MRFASPALWELKLSAGSQAKHIVLIGLGSNVKPRKHLPHAVDALKLQTQLLALSSAWKSPAIGSDGPDFLNAAAKLATDLTADELKATILRPIEADLGRIRGGDPNAERTIDLDILAYDQKDLDTKIWDFAYLALPLSEIEPGLTSTITGETILEAAKRLTENQKIKKSSLKLVS